MVFFYNIIIIIYVDGQTLFKINAVLSYTGVAVSVIGKSKWY